MAGLLPMRGRTHEPFGRCVIGDHGVDRPKSRTILSAGVASGYGATEAEFVGQPLPADAGEQDEQDAAQDFAGIDLPATRTRTSRCFGNQRLNPGPEVVIDPQDRETGPGRALSIATTIPAGVVERRWTRAGVVLRQVTDNGRLKDPALPIDPTALRVLGGEPARPGKGPAQLPRTSTAAATSRLSEASTSG